MSLFEFILVMVSLVLAIAVTHLLEGVARVVRQRRTTEFDWVAPLWAAFLFVLSINHWWSLWDMRDAEWTFPTFFLTVIPPTLLFLAVSLLTSGEGRPGSSLAEDFSNIRVPFFSVLLVFVMLVSWDGYLLGTEVAWNSLRAVQIGVLGLVAAGLATPRWGIQKLVAASALALLVSSAFVLRFLPGAFVAG